MARQQETTDELVEIKNAFYIGNYQQCINEAQKLKTKSPEVKLELDAYLYRSYIALQKHVIVKDELKDNSNTFLLPLKLLAEYFLAENKNIIVNKLDDILSKDINPSNQLLFIVAGTIYYHEQNYDSALRILHQNDSIECSALRLQIFLKLNRLDLANKELKSMQEKDDDAVLTQLAQAWFIIAMGNEKLDDAYYIFQEIIDKHGATSLLLNGQAACFIQQGKYEEADSILQDCIAKDPNNPDTLVNNIVLSRLSGKPPEVAKRYFIQLQETYKDHSLVKEYKMKENEFDKLVSEYAAA